MHGVNEEISWLSMIDGEGRKSSYAMKMRGPCDKCLRAPIGHIGGGEKVRYACGFPVLVSGLPQVYRHTSAVGCQKIAPEPASRHSAVMTVQHIVHPHSSRCLIIDGAQEQ